MQKPGVFLTDAEHKAAKRLAKKAGKSLSAYIAEMVTKRIKRQSAKAAEPLKKHRAKKRAA